LRLMKKRPKSKLENRKVLAMTLNRALADPAVYRGGKWLLPIPFGIDDKLNASALRKKSLSERRVSGLDSRSS
jgi:hypothetical protein